MKKSLTSIIILHPHSLELSAVLHTCNHITPDIKAGEPQV